MEKLVIQIPYGGLGDHLFYSHIPRVYKTCFPNGRIYLSRKSKFRSLAVCDLVWKMNPYLDGETDDNGTDIEINRELGDGNLLDAIMKAYGLDDGAVWHEPEVYYTPNLIPELNGASIYDPNYVSNAGDWLVGGNEVDRFLPSVVHYQLVYREKFLPYKRFHSWLKVNSLFDLCDVIASARNFYCLPSGAATLAASLKSKASVLCCGVDSMFRHSRRNVYVIHDKTPWKRVIAFSLSRRPWFSLYLNRQRHLAEALKCPQVTVLNGRAYSG